jgi:uncharacterized membrane protein
MDSVHTFDLKGDRSAWKKMTINIPQKLEKDTYDLRILVAEREGKSLEYRVKIEVEGARHNLYIKGVVFSPEKVIAGRSLLTYVRMKNYGEEDEETVKVKVTIPELGVSATEFVDELEEDDSITTEELYIRIPKCTESGMYDVDVMLEFDEGYEEITDTYQIEVVADENEICGANGAMDAPEEKTMITIASETQEVTPGGSSVIYPFTISNLGKNAKTYTVTVDGTDFADFSITPGSVVLLDSGEAKAVYVNVKAKEGAEAGEKMFAVTISSGGEVLKEIPLKVVVADGSATDSGFSKVKKGLEIGLVILVVLLVILGLIIGFNHFKRNLF